MGHRAKECRVMNGTRWGERWLGNTRWDRARVGGESQEMNLAKVKEAIRIAQGISRAISTGQDLLL